MCHFLSWGLYVAQTMTCEVQHELTHQCSIKCFMCAFKSLTCAEVPVLHSRLQEHETAGLLSTLSVLVSVACETSAYQHIWESHCWKPHTVSQSAATLLFSLLIWSTSSFPSSCFSKAQFSCGVPQSPVLGPLLCSGYPLLLRHDTQNCTMISIHRETTHTIS